MIISKTPFRISFVGGGSDISAYYEKYGGAVLSTSIDKYTYLSIHPYFADNKILLKYSKHEFVDTVEEIQHPLIREIFKYFNISGVDFSSSADIPSGTGMASSSAFASGLINLCASYTGKYLTKREIAELACYFEIEVLQEPIGKQDQYACSVGGLNLIEFHKDHSVSVEKIHVNPQTISILNNNLMLFYLGKTRSAASVLTEQKKNIEEDVKVANLKKMVSMVYDFKKALLTDKLDILGEILHEGWLLKKQLASGISSSIIDELYQSAIQAGAIGGKLLGAGGGGFLLFYVNDKYKSQVREALKQLIYTPFKFENSGTSIIF